MLYTFALRRNPLKVIPGASRSGSHYFGGPLELAELDPQRFARVLTLDLRDPMLSFLRFPAPITELPLLMDFCEGYISYSIQDNGSVELHSPVSAGSESLLEEQLSRHPAQLESIPYEHYRAAVFQSAVIDDSFLTAEDQSAVRLLGEDFTQVGGVLLHGSDYRPYCSNPACSGCGTQVTSSLASIAREPAPGVSLGYLPDDPAIEFSFCQSCHSISGSVVVD